MSEFSLALFAAGRSVALASPRQYGEGSLLTVCVTAVLPPRSARGGVAEVWVRGGEGAGGSGMFFFVMGILRKRPCAKTMIFCRHAIIQLGVYMHVVIICVSKTASLDRYIVQ